MATRTGIRKAFSFKRPKRATPEETALMLPKLKLIKSKHAARVLELTRTALQAMEELSKIEAEMDIEAAKEVRDDYQNTIPEFKLTFESKKEDADAVVEESGNAEDATAPSASLAEDDDK